jgi:hypothetical protein
MVGPVRGIDQDAASDDGGDCRLLLLAPLLPLGRRPSCAHAPWRSIPWGGDLASRATERRSDALGPRAGSADAKPLALLLVAGETVAWIRTSQEKR